MTKKLEPMINEATAALVPTFCAAILPEAVEAPAWLPIPYADVPYDRDGIRGIQRLDPAIAATLAANWNAAMATDPRGAAGMPLYVGHPDYHANAAAREAWVRDQPPASGWIREMRATPNALEMRVDWTKAGAGLVTDRVYRFFSPYFLSELINTEHGIKIYAPRTIKSAGLTNTPNWPMPPMVNAANTTGGYEDGTNMNLLQRLIALLGDEAIATDDDVVSAVQKMIEAIKTLRESVDARWAAEDAARQALPNAGDTFALASGCIAHFGTLAETLNARADLVDPLTGELATLRGDFARHLVGDAVSRGALLQDHAAARIADMVNAGDAFGTKAKELASLPKLMKTAATATDTAARNTDAVERRQQVLDLVHAEMDKGLGYDPAFARVRKQNPALFALQP